MVWCVGGVLLSRVRWVAVSSALEGLASGFGMGPGVSRSAMTTDTTSLFIFDSRFVGNNPGWVVVSDIA